jgi:hypothetical protein
VLDCAVFAAAVNDALQNNIKKLQEQDNNNVHRIIELETKLHMKVENDVNSKVSDVVDQTLEHRLEQIEQIMHDKFDMKLQEEVQSVFGGVIIDCVVRITCVVVACPGSWNHDWMRSWRNRWTQSAALGSCLSSCWLALSVESPLSPTGSTATS